MASESAVRGGGEVEFGAPASTAATFVAGKYGVFATLGRGGMADVYLAAVQGPAGFNKLVVVKRLRETYADNPSFVSMFLDEARLAARLNHPNVVHTYEIGEQSQGYFIAMEYLEGQPLSRIATEMKHRGEWMEPAFAAHLLAEALHGLHYAHEMRDYDGSQLGIVHRDVSPQNLHVTYDGQVKVLDFGIAKWALNVTQTQVGVLKGKFSYMAPEQAGGEEVDRRSDIFAAGIILWELLAGERLFKGDTPFILNRLLVGTISPPSDKNPAIDPALDAIALKALARNPAHRYQTAQEMANALEDYVLSTGRRIRPEDVAKRLEQLFGPLREQLRKQIQAHMAALPTAGEVNHFVDSAHVPSQVSSPSHASRPGGTAGAYPHLAGHAQDGARRAQSAPSLPVPRAHDSSPASDVRTRDQLAASGHPFSSFDEHGQHHAVNGQPTVVERAFPPATPDASNRGRRSRLVAAAVAAVLLVGAALVVALWRSPKPPAPVDADATKRSAQVSQGDSESFHLTLSSDPLEAQVEWAGKPVGQTPMMIDLLPGPQTFILSREGYFNATLVVNVTDAMAGQTQSRTVVLVPRKGGGDLATAPAKTASPDAVDRRVASVRGILPAPPSDGPTPAPAQPDSHPTNADPAPAAAPSSKPQDDPPAAATAAPASTAVAVTPPPAAPTSTPAAAPPAPAPPTVLPFGPDMSRPTLISGSDPVWTREALIANVEGVMIAKCTITTSGTLQNCRIVKGLPFMDRAMLDSLATRRYTPVMYQGKPVSVEYVFSVRLVHK